jgi:hypothetical protein
MGEQERNAEGDCTRSDASCLGDGDDRRTRRGRRLPAPGCGAPRYHKVARAICEHIQKLAMNRRFLVIFHNGSNEEIDLNSFGFPLSGYLRNKVLWSFQGRFRVYPKTKIDSALKNAKTTTDAQHQPYAITEIVPFCGRLKILLRS